MIQDLANRVNQHNRSFIGKAWKASIQKTQISLFIKSVLDTKSQTSVGRLLPSSAVLVVRNDSSVATTFLLVGIVRAVAAAPSPAAHGVEHLAKTARFVHVVVRVGVAAHVSVTLSARHFAVAADLGHLKHQSKS